MTGTPLGELVAAVSEGLNRPYHFWTAIVVLVAIAGARLVSRWVRTRTQDRLDLQRRAVDASVDALQFSIEGVRRLAFPLAGQAILWLGEFGLRLSGLMTSSADATLLRLAMTLFAAIAVIRLLVYVLRRVFKSLTMIAAFERSIAVAVWLIVALHMAGWLGPVIHWLEHTTLPLGASRVSLWVVLSGAVSVVVTLLGALWLGSAIEARLARATAIDTNVRAVLSRLLQAILVMLGVLIALSLVGIDLTVLSVFGGALGVGLGLGLQRIASNYVSGFIILLDRSLRLGDLITVDKYQGTVTQIKTRYTVLRSADGTEAVVPNEMLVAQAVTNHTFSDKKQRVAVRVVIHHDADVSLAMSVMQEAAGQQANALSDPAPSVALLSFGASGLEFEAAVWVGNVDAGRQAVQSALALSILSRLRAVGVPFPRAQADATGSSPHQASLEPNGSVVGRAA
jgi:small-conductance mechanosensitive channel